MQINAILNAAIRNKATDVHIVANGDVRFRVNGVIRKVDTSVSEPEMDAFLAQYLTAFRREELETRKQTDFSFSAGSTRVRAHAASDFSGRSLSLRLLPSEVIAFEKLGLPASVREKFVGLRQGLVLVVGPTGNGKTTTALSLLNERNKSIPEKIITVEDPVEYILPSGAAMVHQQEMDTFNVKDGVRSALREDPDVLFIGEMRDPETMASAMTLAASGHLVVSTIHAGNVSQALQRIIDSAPSESRAHVREQLGATLAMVVFQRLLPGANGKKVLAYEILNNNIAIRNHIRQNNFAGLQGTMDIYAREGTITFDKTLIGLVQNRSIAPEIAFEHAADKRMFTSGLGSPVVLG